MHQVHVLKWCTYATNFVLKWCTLKIGPNGHKMCHTCVQLREGKIGFLKIYKLNSDSVQTSLLEEKRVKIIVEVTVLLIIPTLLSVQTRVVQ